MYWNPVTKSKEVTKSKRDPRPGEVKLINNRPILFTCLQTQLAIIKYEQFTAIAIFYLLGAENRVNKREFF